VDSFSGKFRACKSSLPISFCQAEYTSAPYSEVTFASQLCLLFGNRPDTSSRLCRTFPLEKVRQVREDLEPVVPNFSPGKSSARPGRPSSRSFRTSPLEKVRHVRELRHIRSTLNQSSSAHPVRHRTRATFCCVRHPNTEPTSGSTHIPTTSFRSSENLQSSHVAQFCRTEAKQHR
jgi:hypothetical protein